MTSRRFDTPSVMQVLSYSPCMYDVIEGCPQSGMLKESNTFFPISIPHPTSFNLNGEQVKCPCHHCLLSNLLPLLVDSFYNLMGGNFAFEIQ